MKIKSAPHFLFLLFLLSSLTSAQTIQVNDTYTAQQLVQDVLINSSCASVSNFTVSGGNFGGVVQSYGYFSAAGTGFPFQEGIVLSTGRAVMAEGPNTSLLDDGGGMDWGGDADLEQALSINSSVNATVLEFDFIPLGNHISFEYMLSSEEYHDNAPCQYSDGFAFLLSQNNSGQPFENLAVVPNTSVPVKVTSVRPQIGGSGGCDAQNAQYFGGFNGSEHPTNFNGQTAVLEAEANVVPGTSYHIKLVIADEGNYRYDSAIFLGGGSFTVTTDLGRDRTLAENNPLCTDETLTLDATNPNALGYQWFKNGAALTGETNPQYIVETPGNYSVSVQLTAICFSEGEINIDYAARPVAANQVLIQCDDDGDRLSVFNLNFATPLLQNNDPSLSVYYFPTQADAENGSGNINNTTAFANTVQDQQVYAVVVNSYGCSAIATVTLTTAAGALIDPAPLDECDDDDGTDDGIIVFDLTQLYATLLAGLPPNIQLQYYTSNADALSGINQIGNPAAFTNTQPGGQVIYAKALTGSDCFGIAEIQLIVYSFGSSLNDEEVILCTNSTQVLDAGIGFTSYRWDTSPVQTTRTITVAQPGNYTVTVTNDNFCEGSKTFVVKQSGPAESAVIEINDFAGMNNGIVITPSGPGAYEFSLDGITYQESPVFTGLTPGKYSIYINDTNGCVPVYKDDIFVLDYPRFFTPNDDGTNDYWHIPYLSSRPDAVVTIFDRYGKVITGFTGNSRGWDGRYENKTLPATDYWFTIKLENERIIRGHFAMIR